MKLYAPSTIREIRNKHGFNLSKGLGQNFLTDKNIIDKIVEASMIDEETLVIEIGPGIGVLTKEAAQYAGFVVAVEIDKKLLPILEETLAGLENIYIVNADILKTDLNKLIEEVKERTGKTFKHVRILGNLPYYITTPIIMKVLEEGVFADSVTVMMQKEVADRIKAEAGTKSYGAITVAVKYYCEVALVASVPREVFYPSPNVDSAVLRLDIRKEKEIKPKNEKIFFECIKAGFGQRRKTLLNSLSGVRGLSKDQIKEVLEEIKIEGNRRAETLSVAEFVTLADTVEQYSRST